MDWIKPSEVAETFLASGVTKAHLPALQLVVRGFLSGALLGFATSVAFTANSQGLPPIVGAVLFPCGFAMIVILGLELVTGSFAMLPAALFSRRIGIGRLLGNLTLVFIGNLIGGLVYGAMYAAVQTQLHHAPATGPAALIVAAAQAKTLGYQKLGPSGMGLSVVKAMLCNWMVCMGGDGAHLTLDPRQNRGLLAAHLHLLRARLRAFGRKHVHHSQRHDDGRACFHSRLVAVEPDTRHRREFDWRARLRNAAHAVDEDCIHNAVGRNRADRCYAD
jgi:hypothetical protein